MLSLICQTKHTTSFFIVVVVAVGFMPSYVICGILCEMKWRERERENSHKRF